MLPDYIPGFELPKDEEIVLGYWKEKAVAWAAAHHDRLAEYDHLTGQLEQAFGPDWRTVVRDRIAANKQQTKAGAK